MEKKYELDFYQALKIVMNSGAVKGEQFVDGIFLKLNMFGQLVIVDGCRLYEEDINVFISHLHRQKFREVQVFTVKELSF